MVLVGSLFATEKTFAFSTRDKHARDQKKRGLNSFALDLQKIALIGPPSWTLITYSNEDRDLKAL